MAVSFVNGFTCTSSCDVAKAKKGQDPHPAAHAAEPDAKDEGTLAVGGSSQSNDQAVVFGGSLAAIVNASRVTASSASQQSGAAASDNRHAVDLLV